MFLLGYIEIDRTVVSTAEGAAVVLRIADSRSLGEWPPELLRANLI
jgi:hypothetical protein